MEGAAEPKVERSVGYILERKRAPVVGQLNSVPAGDQLEDTLMGCFRHP